MNLRVDFYWWQVAMKIPGGLPPNTTLIFD